MPLILKILKATPLAIPFLIVRTTYALLSVFATSLDSKWDTIDGSAVAFAFMALLMEYVVVCIYLYIGFSIPLANPRTRDRELGRIEVGISQVK